MELNSEQLEAADWMEGACLVSANPGSGKTRVITERVVRLIEKGVSPKSVLCITFTRKAAGEMKKRICDALGSQDPGFFIGTFHSFCVRLIRRIGPGRGYSSNFNILDTKSQIDFTLQIARSMEIEINEKDARTISNCLNWYRDQMEDFSYVENNLKNLPMINIAREYIRRTRELNMLDFSSLISEAIRIIEEDKGGIKEKVQRFFKYICVDEFHDSNENQAYLVNLLGGFWNNVMIVSDRNQSIYKFRGARYQNIQDFIDSHENCKIIQLPINYRSTPEIIDVASKLIKYNDNNENFKMITDNKNGESVKCYSFKDQNHEADFVANQIRKLVDEGGWSYKDIACIYRMNKMSQPLEQAMVNKNINYKNVGAYNFFDRTECRDSLSALRLISNRNDSASFYRIAKLFPGMGDITIGKIEKKAIEDKISLIDACIGFKKISNSIKVKNACQKIYDIYSQNRDFTNPAKCLNDVVEEMDYIKYLEGKYDEGAEERKENVGQLIDSCSEFNGPDAIYKYLQNVTLITSVDQDDNDDNFVSLISIHSVKGLEFECCFVVGWEQGIIPHNLAMKEDPLEGICEERRLGYVAISRAKKILYITRCLTRKGYGSYGKMNYRKTKPSQFLFECGLLKENKNY